jgi:hypothetical protein
MGQCSYLTSRKIILKSKYILEIYYHQLSEGKCHPMTCPCRYRGEAAKQYQPIRNPVIKGSDKLSRTLHYWSTQLTISRPWQVVLNSKRMIQCVRKVTVHLGYGT